MSDDGSAVPGRFDEAMSVKGATTKATRERQRRIRLNDSFMELAKALDPGKTPKTDKASIVADAIRVVTQLRTENGQLQQLNKFLEERVGTLEKARADVMMRQAMYQGLNPNPFMQSQPQQQQQPQQQPQQQQPQPQTSMVPPGGVVMGHPVQGLASQPSGGVGLVMATGQPMGQGQVQACSSSRMEVKGENSLAQATSGPMFAQAPSAMGQLSELLNSDQGIFDWALDTSGQQDYTDFYKRIGSPGEQAWLPLPDGASPDTTQDHIKRPPAA